MNEERQALAEFLQHKQFSYCNPAGVIFYRMADGSLYVAAGYPCVEETPLVSLGFFQQFNHVKQFMSLLHFCDAERLDDVTPKDLYLLYKGELLDIVCTLKGKRSREMRFRRLGGMIWAVTKKKMHLLRIPSHEPEDFISYTMRYYKIIQS